MEREIKIIDYGRDCGFCQYNAYCGSELITRTNNLDDLLLAIYYYLKWKEKRKDKTDEYN